MNITRKIILLAACLLAAGAITACGSSSSSSSTSAAAAASASSGGSSTTGASGSFAAARSKFAACLKSHGVTLPSRPGGFRRPNGSGNGPPAGAGGGAPPPGGFGGGGGGGRGRGFFRRFGSNPKMAAAFKACASDLPRGGFRGRFARPNHAAITKFVTCVRQHGYNLPEPNFSGKGPIFSPRIASNPKFRTASRSCASLLRPSGAPPASGEGGAPSNA